MNPNKDIADILRGIRAEAEHLANITDPMSTAHCVARNISDDVTAVLYDYVDPAEYEGGEP